MAILPGLILLLLALAMVAESSSHYPESNWGITHLSGPSRGDGGLCSGSVGDCIDLDEELMMESESSRRVLTARRYIGYDAMQKNNVPCNRRGNSYYNCNDRRRANPYRRGCNVITRCGRRT